MKKKKRNKLVVHRLSVKHEGSIYNQSKPLAFALLKEGLSQFKNFGNISEVVGGFS